jgi:hypothetical protein
LEADDRLAAGVGDDGGGVSDAVTQLLRFGDGEVAVEATQDTHCTGVSRSRH